MDRAILHCDLNNFFASVACRDNPEIAALPVAIGGSTSDRHGIILAKNELAKKYKVQTGEPLWKAKSKCPNLIIVPPDYNRYLYFSQIAKEIYSEYSDQVEAFGMDECWIDVSGSRSLFGKEDLIANEIRNRTKKELGLTISVGVSFNKIFSKIGSDMKKPDAVTVIDSSHYKSIIWPMPVNTILGVGPATKKRLSDIGIYTLGDLANASLPALKVKLGKVGENLWKYANGRDSSIVINENEIVLPKSIGRSITCRYDLTNTTEIFNVILSLSEDVATELRAKHLSANGVTIHTRTADLETAELQIQLEKPTQLAFVLAKNGIDLFKKNYDFSKPLRSVGIRAINLTNEKLQYQLNLFDDYEKDIKTESIERSMDLIRGKYGRDSIVRASTLRTESGPMPKYGLKACFNHIVNI